MHSFVKCKYGGVTKKAGVSKIYEEKVWKKGGARTNFSWNNVKIKLTSVSLFTAFSFYLMFYLLISPAKCTLMVIFFFEEHENINANRFCQKQWINEQRG